MIRTKGEAGTGDIVNAVTHMRAVFGGIRRLQSLRGEELFAEAKNLQAPYELVRWVAENGRLPVVTFTAGGIATPADASLCMQLGADGVFVGSGIFKSGQPVAAGARDRRGDDALHGRRRARARLGRPRRGDGRHLDAVARAERPARAPRLVARLGCWSPAVADTSAASSSGARRGTAGTFARPGGGSGRSARPSGCTPTFAIPPG